MRRYPSLPALLLLVLIVPVASAFRQNPVPGASSALAGTAEAFLSGCRNDLNDTKKRVLDIKASKAPRDAYATLQAFDTAILLASDAEARAGLAEQVHPAKDFRDAAQTCEQESVQVLTNITLDRQLYDSLKSLDPSKLDKAGAYFLRTTLRDYHRAGVDRDEATRSKIRRLQNELVKITQEFDRNIADDVRKLEVNAAELDGLPDDFKRSHPPDAAGKITLKTDNTDYVPVMQYANSEALRKSFQTLYYQRAYPQNIDVLTHMLQKRHELATTLGYPDWAAYTAEDKMVGTKQNAADFIDKISAVAQPRADRDYQTLLALKKRQDPNATSVGSWDFGHLSYLAVRENYGYDSQVVRPYFEYSRVQRGILDLTSKFYGITYKKVDKAQVWHPDVQVYDVLDGNNLLGRIYFDMFPRENKYKHYATFNLATGKKGVRVPEYVLVCNFPQPKGNEPGLMEREDVITFFHEYGHLLHGIFRGSSEFPTGDLESDFIEAPSQLLEEWPVDPATVQLFARHYQTNEPIPLELAKKAKAADEFGRGLDVRLQMLYAAISLNYYNRDPQSIDTTQILDQLRKKYSPFEYPQGTHMQTAFGHLQGYSAAYYTYMWSLVIAKDMFTEFKHDGMMNRAVFAKYRNTVLAPSGTMPAADMITNFLGRPYSFTAYGQWLNGN
ncbi:MAG TPA: M3 family metallopeptidase [Terriglobales bacterium]|nr:M3 family metallopeptidase [Terriglobales bacterium]